MTDTPQSNIFMIGTRKYPLPAQFDISKYVYAVNESIARRHVWMPEDERISSARCIVGCAIEDVLREYLQYVPQLLSSQDPEFVKTRKLLISPDGKLDYRKLLELDLQEEHLDQRIGQPSNIDLEKAESICDTYRTARSRPLAYGIHNTINGVIYLPLGISVLEYIDGARNALKDRHPQTAPSMIETLAQCIVGCTLINIQARIIEQHKLQIQMAQDPVKKELRQKISDSLGRPIWNKLAAVYLTERDLHDTFGGKSSINLSNTADIYCSEYQGWQTRIQDFHSNAHRF